jgi:hypothetical protein
MMGDVRLYGLTLLGDVDTLSSGVERQFFLKSRSFSYTELRSGKAAIYPYLFKANANLKGVRNCVSL